MRLILNSVQRVKLSPYKLKFFKKIYTKAARKRRLSNKELFAH